MTLRRIPLAGDGSRLDELRAGLNASLDDGIPLDVLKAHLELILLNRQWFRMRARDWFERVRVHEPKKETETDG